jgi:RimJ/RimL family protein N-acetyltransferase
MKTPLSLRPARATDCRQVWTWANDPVARSMSFSTDPIPWETHQRWFADKLADERCFFYIVFDAADRAIGLVRFDGADDREATISVSIGEPHRGRRLAAEAIRLGCEAAERDGGIRTVDAYVRPANTASLRAFARAGFAEQPDSVVDGQPARHLRRGPAEGEV